MEYFDLAHGGSVDGLCGNVDGLVMPRQHNVISLTNDFVFLDNVIAAAINRY